MDNMGWGAVLQALVLAVCTWYMRHGSKRDASDVKEATASPSDVRRVENQVKLLREEFDILKAAYFKQNPVVDDRGPRRDKNGQAI